MVNAMFLSPGLSHDMWGKAIISATYLLDKIPCKENKIVLMNYGWEEDYLIIVLMEIGRSSRIDDEVVQDQRQRDDNDLQDERQDQPKEEEVEPRRSKRARIEKSFGPDFVSFMVENEPTSYREAIALETDAFLAIEDEPISLEIDDSYYDSKGDILLLEEFLNDDPSSPPLPPQELKVYAFLEFTDKLPVIIAKDLKDKEKAALIKILMEDDFKLAVQHQRRVNPKIHEVIKKEVLRLLDAGLIYPISDSPWVSLVYCVPKKGGFTVVENDENYLIPTRLVTGWRVCIDYRKLNDATRKDHFPLPFLDQMLERLAGNEYYCFLDGFSGYFQIPIDPQDQEKTTFTCPYGTFAYRRMPFGLCNAPGTFQRCMMAIFHDMNEKTMEVFMDDFSVFRNSFGTCLSHSDKMLKRCEDTNLCLNWEKSHFMVKEGIVLGHKISKNGIEVDKAKVDVIAKLPHPTTVKGIQSFLGHAGFYRRFIQDFSKIARPMTRLLKKDTPFFFSKECIEAF
ncbi:reverse transcriptase domain-containing protein [Tanacetum coccineum]